MENYMNKLFKSNQLLSDKNLNKKIEKIFENNFFQKLVEKTDVLKDEDLSLTQSNIGDKKILTTSLLNSILIEKVNQDDKLS